MGGRLAGAVIAALALLAAACGAVTLDIEETVTEPAPIVSVELRIAESDPPQYFLDIVSRQPTECHTFSGHGVEREADRIEIIVYNNAPADGASDCAASAAETETAVALGSDFEPGRTYTPTVNGEPFTFVAQ